MKVTATEYYYREWRPTVQGMRNAVGRQVEWAAPPFDIQSERGTAQEQHTLSGFTHRLLMGARKGFGQNRCSRTIQGAYRSIPPLRPSLMAPLT
jgi:hypothetical protein